MTKLSATQTFLMMNNDLNIPSLEGNLELVPMESGLISHTRLIGARNKFLMILDGRI